jgi:LysM repeat protein
MFDYFGTSMGKITSLRFIFGGMFFLFFSACTPSAITPTPVPELTCGDYTVSEATLSCVMQPNGVLIQTPLDSQITLTGAEHTLTVKGTAYVHQDAEALAQVIMALEGTVIVSARGNTRILSPGSQVTLSFTDAGRVTNLSALPVPMNALLLQQISIITLNRPVPLPSPIAPPPGFTPPPTMTFTPTPISLTQLATGIPTPRPAGCVVRADWTDNYTVSTGDNISRIAARFGVSASELSEGNCVSNPDRIRIGQNLRVPVLPTPTPTIAPTFTPSAVAFRADKNTLSGGDCTVIRWDVLNVSAVFFEEQTTTGSNIQQVCPAATTTYTLRVIYPDGSQTTHEVTITLEN